MFSDYASWNPLGYVSAKDMGAMGSGKIFGNALTSGMSGALGGMSLGPIEAGIDAGVNMISSLIGSAARNRAARKAAERVNQQIDITNDFNQRSFANRIDNIADTQMNDLLANYAAYGGHLYKDGGGIHIKPGNRGKFTETKRRTGKTTEELTHSKNPLTRKRAIFA